MRPILSLGILSSSILVGCFNGFHVLLGAVSERTKKAEEVEEALVACTVSPASTMV
jgi:hypothetical protein